MANDQSNDASQRDEQRGGQPGHTDRLDDLARKHGGLHEGMTSPDSTQAPLRADTGEPDEDALGGRSGRGDASSSSGGGR